MLNKEVKEEILAEEDLDKVLKILEPYEGDNWGPEIMQHIQKITPEDTIPINRFSYIRKNK